LRKRRNLYLGEDGVDEVLSSNDGRLSSERGTDGADLAVV
jgi:hypothetical protein